MMLILQGILLFLMGHVGAALAVYFNHRYVFHGNLGHLPLLKETRRKHILSAKCLELQTLLQIDYVKLFFNDP